MILKERLIPLNIKKLEALLRRLPNNHMQRKRIEQDLNKYNAGFQGEKSLDYHISFFNGDQYLIIHDVRLVDNEKRYFQIDTIILSTRMIMILEVKNIAGTLYFDNTFKQLIRILDDKEEAFNNPILQVERQKLRLQSWLAQYKYEKCSIIPLVVLSNSKTIIKASSNHKEIAKKVIHSELLYKIIKDLELIYQKEIYSQKEIMKIAKFIIKENKFFNQDILEKYNIEDNEILTGVICESCNNFSMERIRGRWRCPHCFFYSKESHQSALNDYLLLFGNAITNKRLRNFLHVNSVYNASRLLSSLKLISTGSNKGKVYYLNEAID